MTGDREKWDRKYRERRFPAMPSRIVRDFCHLAPGGRALDLACGTGRNACFLAARGYQVDAVDISEEGLRRFVCPPVAVNRICQALETFVIAPRRYQLIVNTRFLQRHLFTGMQEGLSPGGVVIFETFLRTDDPDEQQRFRREHLLRSGELHEAFSRLEILHYHEGPSRAADVPARQASLVARRPRPI